MSDVIHINNVFWTIQGEGRNAGRLALFVRMPFCNLACSWCDTEYNTFKKWTREEFIKEASKVETNRFAVITGGEPTVNKHTPIVIALLKELGFEIAVESNGYFPIPEGIDFVTISPKRNDQTGVHYFVHPDAYQKASEFKYVVDNHFDFSILERHNIDYQLGRKVALSLSPEFTEMKKNINTITQYIQENPQWRVSLQTHKWMEIP